MKKRGFIWSAFVVSFLIMICGIAYIGFFMDKNTADASSDEGISNLLNDVKDQNDELLSQNEELLSEVDELNKLVAQLFVTMAKADLHIGLNDNVSADSIVSDITLPTALENHSVTITWTSSKSNVIKTDGTVVSVYYDTQVVLTATIKFNGITVPNNTKTFNVTVIHVKSDTEINVDSAIASAENELIAFAGDNINTILPNHTSKTIGDTINDLVTEDWGFGGVAKAVLFGTMSETEALAFINTHTYYHKFIITEYYLKPHYAAAVNSAKAELIAFAGDDINNVLPDATATTVTIEDSINDLVTESWGFAKVWSDIEAGTISLENGLAEIARMTEYHKWVISEFYLKAPKNVQAAIENARAELIEFAGTNIDNVIPGFETKTIGDTINDLINESWGFAGALAAVKAGTMTETDALTFITNHTRYHEGIITEYYLKPSRYVEAAIIAAKAELIKFAGDSINNVIPGATATTVTIEDSINDLVNELWGFAGVLAEVEAGTMSKEDGLAKIQEMTEYHKWVIAEFYLKAQKNVEAAIEFGKAELIAIAGAYLYNVILGATATTVTIEDSINDLVNESWGFAGVLAQVKAGTMTEEDALRKIQEMTEYHKWVITECYLAA